MKSGVMEQTHLLYVNAIESSLNIIIQFKLFTSSALIVAFFRSISYNPKDHNSVVLGKKVNVDIKKHTNIEDELVMLECTNNSDNDNDNIVYRTIHKQIVPRKVNLQNTPFPKRGIFVFSHKGNLLLFNITSILFIIDL